MAVVNIFRTMRKKVKKTDIFIYLNYSFELISLRKE